MHDFSDNPLGGSYFKKKDGLNYESVLNENRQKSWKGYVYHTNLISELNTQTWLLNKKK